MQAVSPDDLMTICQMMMHPLKRQSELNSLLLIIFHLLLNIYYYLYNGIAEKKQISLQSLYHGLS